MYRFPERGIVELSPVDNDSYESGRTYSVSQAAVAELEAQQLRADVQRFREELAEMNALAREEEMDGPPLAPVPAYRQVYR